MRLLLVVLLVISVSITVQQVIEVTNWGEPERAPHKWCIESIPMVRRTYVTLIVSATYIILIVSATAS